MSKEASVWYSLGYLYLKLSESLTNHGVSHNDICCLHNRPKGSLESESVFLWSLWDFPHGHKTTAAASTSHHHKVTFKPHGIEWKIKRPFLHASLLSERKSFSGAPSRLHFRFQWIRWYIQIRLSSAKISRVVMIDLDNHYLILGLATSLPKTTVDFSW